MAVTPLVPTHRITVTYHVDALTHKIQFLVDAGPGSSGPSPYVVTTKAGASQDVDDVVQAYADIAKAVLPASNAIIDSYDLELYSGGAYLAIYSNTIAKNGTNTDGRSTYNRMTTVYRDDNTKLVRSVLMGVSLIAPQRGGQSISMTPFGAYFGTFITATGLNVGNWMRGRSGGFLAGATFYTVSLDRKSRRRAGLI